MEIVILQRQRTRERHRAIFRMTSSADNFPSHST